MDVILIGAALLLTAGVAHAGEDTHAYPQCLKEPTEAELSAAKGAFEAGDAAFREANYTRAISYWEDAYERDCTANALLLNLARVFELVNRKAQAIITLQTYLDREPKSEGRELILRRIETLKQDVENTASAPTEDPIAEPPTPHVPQIPAASKSPAAKKPVTPLIVMGGGGALFVGGAITFLIGGSKVGDVDSRCYRGADCARDAHGQLRTRERAQQLRDEGNVARSVQTAGAIVGGIGAMAFLVGIGWFALTKAHGKEQASADTRFVPTLSRDLAGVAVLGRF